MFDKKRFGWFLKQWFWSMTGVFLLMAILSLTGNWSERSSWYFLGLFLGNVLWWKPEEPKELEY